MRLLLRGNEDILYYCCRLKPSNRPLYDGRMQSIEIDPELNRLALAEAAQQYPEFAEHALRVVASPLSRGFAWRLEWKGAPPSGQQAWEFQNTAIRAYKRLARITE